MADADDPPTPAETPAPGPSNASPEAVRSFRSQLTAGEDVVDPATWAGSVPVARGIAPRVRVGRSRWFNLLWLLPIGLLGLVAAVAAAKGLRGVGSVQGFIEEYPGTVFPAGAERNAGLPIWVGAMHFLNLFLMIFIIRSGVQILSDHPRLYWTRHSTPGKDWFRIQKPVPADPLWTAKNDSISLPGQVGLPGIRHSIGGAPVATAGGDALAVCSFEAGAPELAGAVIRGRFDAHEGTRAMVALCATHQEPLVVPTRDELESRLDATAMFWRRWSDDLTYVGPWRDAVVRSACAQAARARPLGSARGRRDDLAAGRGWR